MEHLQSEEPFSSDPYFSPHLWYVVTYQESQMCLQAGSAIYSQVTKNEYSY